MQAVQTIDLKRTVSWVVSAWCISGVIPPKFMPWRRLEEG